MNTVVNTKETPTPMLSVENLRKIYAIDRKNAVVEALRGISLSVAEGEFFGILGPNGAGKSTILGCITTLVKPTSGTVRVAGIEVSKESREVKRQIAVVPQQRNLDQSLNVREILVYHGRYFGMPAREREQRADRLLADMKISDKAKAKVQALSGGTQQRVMIARALMHDPKLLLLDEPTTGLDPQARRQIWESLQELHAQRLTIILTTHYMEEADRLCQRLAVIDSGRILSIASPRVLKQELRSTQILELSGTSSVALDGALAGISGITRVETLEAAENGYQRLRLFLDSANGVVDEVLSVVRRSHLDLQHFALSPPSLEDVYIQLTGKELRE